MTTTENQSDVMTKKAVTMQFKESFRSFLMDAILNCPSVVAFLKEAEEVIGKIDMTIPLSAILRTSSGPFAVSALGNLQDTVKKLKEERIKLDALLTGMSNTELLHLCAYIANMSGELKHDCPSNGIVTFWFNVERHALILKQVIDCIELERLPTRHPIRDANNVIVGYTKANWEEDEIQNHG